MDVRTLPPDLEVPTEAVTLEVPWAAAVLQDFALRPRGGAPSAAVFSYERAPPTARTVAGGVEFLLAGHASPGDEVKVDGAPVAVDAQGNWRTGVQLQPGANTRTLTVLGADNVLHLFRQTLDVVAREDSLLIVPRAPQPRGSLRLPGRRGEPPASGASSLLLELPPGSSVSAGGRELAVGAEGSVLVPLTLAPGSNAVKLWVRRPGEPAGGADGAPGGGGPGLRGGPVGRGGHVLALHP